ncbi:M20 family metallopeptidase [uncultured Mailhella sp.]|uniref:M20 metallopeptidase family protein n=1 Tax=uncultured Mailhella sp. TaxID=1981031 RepID=UPI00262B0E79|nr:M20 family metallopeptidase [uncultured Mailhella sp.]
MEDFRTEFLQSAQALQEELTAWRRDLHQHPELGFDLTYTKAFVKARLEEMGYQPKACGKAGLTVTAGKPAQKCVLIRGDMDALPIQEEADVPYRSQTPGQMHACGHDMHTAMMLGAAKLLKKYEDKLAGQVKLMFQPAEEIMAGSQDMIENGVLEGVDAALMLHVMTGTPIPRGFIMIPEGGTGSASSDFFTITVKGKGGHGAMPQLSIDPITAAAHILLALQEIHARELTPGDFLVITPGIFQAGKAANVIPDTAVMQGTIRTGDVEMVAFAKKRIAEIAEATAKAFRTEAVVEFSGSCPPMIADNSMSDAARKYLTELMPQHILPPMTGNGNKIGGGSEDFAFVSVQVPTIGLFLSTGGTGDGCQYPQHHPKAVFDDSVLHLGAAAYSYFAIRWLADNNP